MQRRLQWRIQRAVGAAAPIGSYFFQKAVFLRVKGIYFAVYICDK